MSRPHLALLVGEPPTTVGGVERCATALAELARELGWRVSWQAASAAVPPVLRVHRGARWLRPWWGVVAAAALAVHLRRRWRDAPPDLIVSHGAVGWGLGPELDRRRVHFYHGTYAEQARRATSGLSPAGAWLLRHLHGGFAEGWAGRTARRAVANAPGTAREVRHHYGVAAEVVGLPLDLAAYAGRDRKAARRALGLPLGRPIVAAVLRESPNKGADRWRRMVQAAPTTWTWVVAGSATGVEAEHVVSLGIVPPERIADLYAAADVLVVPSRYEPFGYVIAEALAAGTPVVAPSEAGAAELLMRGTALEALLVDRGEADAPRSWIERVRRVLTEREAWLRRVAELRPRLERWLEYPAWRERLVQWLEEVARA